MLKYLIGNLCILGMVILSFFSHGKYTPLMTQGLLWFINLCNVFVAVSMWVTSGDDIYNTMIRTMRRQRIWPLGLMVNMAFDFIVSWLCISLGWFVTATIVYASLLSSVYINHIVYEKTQE
jgi:hypothetical protein